MASSGSGFDWMKFSRNEGGTISIGDAFSEGMVLSQDNVLVIRILML